MCSGPASLPRPGEADGAIPQIFLGNGRLRRPPAEVLTRILQPLWSVAVAVARDEQAEAQAAVAAANSASRKSSLSAARALPPLHLHMMKRSCEAAR